MHVDLFEILRCPYCGGRLELVTSIFNRVSDDTISDGVLGCQCCVFPVVDGIPVMHLHPASVKAREAIEAGQPDRALLAMVGVEEDEQVDAFAATAASPSATFKQMVEALGPGFEGGYFLYRFSDPTFVVADAVVRTVAGAALRGGGRALDICGGSGHLTRNLVPLSSPAPVLADLFYPKVWLARRYTAPGAIPVCCDGNAPLPFAHGSFDVAMCSDAFMFIWMKRLFVSEMFRAVAGSPNATVLINHTHNQLVWSPSHGNALLPSGYRGLFDTVQPRVFGESGLFEGLVERGVLDLSRRDDEATLDAEVALTLIASSVEGIFESHAAPPPATSGGEWRINPLYQVRQDEGRLALTLQFPSPDYEDEYGACRRYLPESVSLDRAAFAGLQAGTAQPSLAELIARRVLIHVPRLYF